MSVELARHFRALPQDLQRRVVVIIHMNIPMPAGVYTDAALKYKRRLSTRVFHRAMREAGGIPHTRNGRFLSVGFESFEMELDSFCIRSRFSSAVSSACRPFTDTHGRKCLAVSVHRRRRTAVFYWLRAYGLLDRCEMYESRPPRDTALQVNLRLSTPVKGFFLVLRL